MIVPAFLFKAPINYNLIMLFINFHRIDGTNLALRHAIRSTVMLNNHFLGEHVARFGWRLI